MSMNLVCDEFELLQTPTWVTDICLSWDPVYKCSDGGWQGILRRYIIWVEGCINGSYKTQRDLDDTKTFYNDHINKLKKIAKAKGYLTFSYI